MKQMKNTAVYSAARITRRLDATDVLVGSFRALCVRITETEA